MSLTVGGCLADAGSTNPADPPLGTANTPMSELPAQCTNKDIDGQPSARGTTYLNPYIRNATGRYLVLKQSLSTAISANGEAHLLPYHGAAISWPDPALRAELAKVGLTEFEVAQYSSDLTPAFLKRFNLVVINASGGNYWNKADVTKLMTYVAGGGGLLVLRTSGYQYGVDIKNFNDTFGPSLKLEISDEQVVDTPTELSSGAVVSWTCRFNRPHPIIAGIENAPATAIKRFYYPSLAKGLQFSDSTSPLWINPHEQSNWTTVVSAMDASYSARRNKKTGQFYRDNTYQANRAADEVDPPLLAVTDHGKGRIAVMAIASSAVWQDSTHAYWGYGIMSGESAGVLANPLVTPGDNNQLMVNTFLYLADGKPPQVSYYEWTPPKERSATALVKNKTHTITPIDWNNIIDKFPEEQLPEDYVGLIGARSSYSGGDYAPEDFIAYAQGAKYDFIVFAEHLDHPDLNASNYGKLQDLCKATNAANIGTRAYAGLKYQDTDGNEWLAFGPDVVWPKGFFAAQIPFHRPLVSNTKLNRGPWKFSPTILLHPKEAPWFQGNFNGLATFVYPYEKGLPQPADNHLDQYRLMQKEGFNLSSLAVHLIDDPTKIASIKKSSLFQTHIRWFDSQATTTDLIKALSGHGEEILLDIKTSPTTTKKRPYPFRPVYVSNGPIIRDAYLRGWGMAPPELQEGHERAYYHFNVSSDAAISEVRVLDGEQLWRRYVPDNSKKTPLDFEYGVEVFHDRQYDLMLEVTDTAGKKAYGWTNSSYASRNYFVRCKDNWNTLPQGWWLRKPTGAHNTRGMETSMFLRSFGSFHGLPSATVMGLSPTKPGTYDQVKTDLATRYKAVEYYPTWASQFGQSVIAIQNDHWSKDVGDPNRTDVDAMAEENEYVKAMVRHTMFSSPHDSMLVTRIEGEVHFKKTFKAATDFNVIHWTRNRREPTRLVISNGIKKTWPVVPTTKVDHTLTVPKNHYAVLGPDRLSGFLAVIPLGGDYVVNVQVEPKNRALRKMSLKLPNTSKVYSANSKPVTYDYLLIKGALKQDNFAAITAELDTFVKELGLQTGISAVPITATYGTVKSAGYPIVLEAQGGGFYGTVAKSNLSMQVPIAIKGLNPNWDAGVWYPGQHLHYYHFNSFDNEWHRTPAKGQIDVPNYMARFPVVEWESMEDLVGVVQLNARDTGKKFFAGNLLVSDCDQLVLSLVGTNPADPYFVAHNPTDKAMPNCLVWPGWGFELYGNWDVETGKIPPGTSQAYDIKAQP